IHTSIDDPSAVCRITPVVRRTNILCPASCLVIYFITGDLSAIYGLKRQSADYRRLCA
ncbi:hypothetical protein HAX54_019347, partial [Datura stramonium]|nr:hypothetical protein [Datura stramonium]